MAFSDPKQVILESGLSEGSMVADFGAGSGHYAIAAAKAVGMRGRVYAVEIQKELLRRIKADASAQGIRNLEIVWGDLEKEGGSKLRGGTVDTVILANALFQVEHRSALLEEVRRVLKPGGKLVFIEWKDSYGGIGPRLADVVPEHTARELLERVGLKVERPLRSAGDHHYGLIAKKL